MSSGHGAGGFRGMGLYYSIFLIDMTIGTDIAIRPPPNPGYTVVFQQFKFDGLQPRRGIWLGFRHSDAETLHRELTPRRWPLKRGGRQVETGEPKLGGFW